MIKHIVMFKLKGTDNRSEYENAIEAKQRFSKVIENVTELKKGESTPLQCSTFLL